MSTTDPGLPDAVEPVALVLAEHWGAGIEPDGQWECSCGFPLGRADDAQDDHIAHQSAEVLAALGVPDLIQQAKADNDARWRALVGGIAIGARATGNFDRERAALDILALDERMP